MKKKGIWLHWPHVSLYITSQAAALIEEITSPLQKREEKCI